MQEYYSATHFIRLARLIRMKRLLLPAAGALFWLQAFAQSPVDGCARARDPLRCEACQAVLKACSEKHGAGKQACLEAGMPPVDCSKASNPEIHSRAESRGNLQGQSR